MGSEQSSENDNRSARNNRQSAQMPQLSEAEKKRILDAQRREYERKCQELLAAQNAKAMQTAAATLERERAPYQYDRNDLHGIGAQNTLYPNLNNNVPHPSANVPHPSVNVPHPSANIPHPSACAPNPFANVAHHSANVPHPSACAPNPFANVPHPSANVTHHSANVNNSYQNRGQPNVRPPQEFVFVNSYGQPERAPMPTAPSAPRERSVSRNRNTANDKEYNCPTCHCRYGLVIYQCPSGHSACSVCKTTGRNCRLCGQYFLDKRNYDLERFISQMKVPCPNAGDGCKLYISMADTATHINECPFKEQLCPLAAIFGNCHWRGKLNQISKHFDSMHSAQRQTDVDTEMRLTNINHNSQQVHLVVIGVYNFLVHIKVSEREKNIYMTTQLIGTKMSAARWTYEVHVYNKSENRRKFTYIDSCSSSSESVEDIFKDGACATIPVAYATTFVNEGALTFKFLIKKTNEGFRDFGKNHRGRGRKKE